MKKSVFLWQLADFLLTIKVEAKSLNDWSTARSPINFPINAQRTVPILVEGLSRANKCLL